MLEIHVETIYLLRIPSMEMQPHWSRLQINLCCDGSTRHLCNYNDLIPHKEALDWAEGWIHRALKKFDPPHFYRKP